jgi:hypothetical protein
MLVQTEEEGLRQDGNVADVNLCKVALSGSALKLANSMDKRSTLDVSDSSTCWLYFGVSRRGHYGQLVNHCLPSSMMQTSGSAPDSSTGILATRSIQS